MLFCKKCGNRVEKSDTFCTSCMCRLDAEGAILDKREYSAVRASATVQFDAEAVVGESDISGFEVLEYMLTEKIASLCGSEYYKAVFKNAGERMDTVVRHIRFPQYTDRDVCAMMHRMDYGTVDKLAEQFASKIPQEVLSFQAQCVSAGVDSLNYTAKILHSEIYNCYHIFIMMKQVKPFISYVSQEKLTLRDVISIGIALSEQLLRLQRQGYSYGAFSDLSVFVDSDGKPYLDCRIIKLYEEFFPYTSIVMYNKTFVSPMNKNFEAYSLAMLLYRLLSGFNSPYINPYIPQISNEELVQAEEKRMMAKQPILPEKARNMAGTKIVDAISSSDHSVTLEELHNVLENSFTYISAAELNEYIND